MKLGKNFIKIIIIKKTEVILLLSGGIDSTTLLAELTSQSKQVHAISFDYGQRHLAEINFAITNAAHYHVIAHHIIKLDFESISATSMLTNQYKRPINYQEVPLPQGPNETYVPGRNLLMLGYAAAYAEANGLKDIYLAVNADDGQRFPDCKPVFVDALNKLWQGCPNTEGINVLVPNILLTKARVILKSIELGVNLQQTLSCYAPLGHKECGTCLSCVLKKEALNQALR